MPEPTTFRFRISEAFTLTGRGTVVMGDIEQGDVRTGDTLRFVHGDLTRDVTCRGVTSPRIPDWKPGDPVTIALLVPDLDKTEVAPGDFLLGDV